MKMSQNNAHAQLIAQWITSLAISVICCAVLFVVFAGYIVDLHNSINLATVRLEVIQEKNNQILSDLNALRRGLIPQAALPPSLPMPPPSPEVAAPPQPPSAGVQISEPAPVEPNEKGEMTPVMIQPKAPEAGQAASPQPSTK